MKKNPFAVIPAALLAAFSFSCAAYAEGDEGDGHFYLGGSTGYFKPDTERLGGNTRTLGTQAGYQFNDRWSAEMGFQMDAFGPGEDDLKMFDLEFIRHWGDEFRFLVEFGYTHVTLDANGSDDATAGFHIGTGLSAFMTDNLELRGDIKLIQTKNEGLLDGMGTLSLNYHFGKTRTTQEDDEPVLGSAEPAEESLAPIEYREPIEAEEVADVVAPAVVEEPAPAVVEEPAPAVVEEPAPVVAPEPQPAPAAVVAVPKSVHTLLNFDPDSIDVNAKYGQQLDQISNEIISTNSKAVVEGHTDGQGTPVYNKVLSADRAIVVKRELKNRGVKGEDVSIVGYGEERPVATNETAEGREQNRRVEVKLYDKQ